MYHTCIPGFLMTFPVCLLSSMVSACIMMYLGVTYVKASSCYSRAHIARLAFKLFDGRFSTTHLHQVCFLPHQRARPGESKFTSARMGSDISHVQAYILFLGRQDDGVSISCNDDSTLACQRIRQAAPGKPEVYRTGGGRVPGRGIRLASRVTRAGWGARRLSIQLFRDKRSLPCQVGQHVD